MFYFPLIGAVTRRTLAIAFLLAGTTLAYAAPLVDKMKTTTINVSSVDGALVDGEVIKFKGLLKVQTRLAPDPEFNKPSLVVFVDLKNVSATSAVKAKAYKLSSQEEFTLPSAPNQSIEFTFPFTPSETALLIEAISGVIRLTFNVDETGAITSAVATATVR